MDICNAVGSPVEMDLQQQEGGRVTLTLSGRLELESMGACWRALEKRLRAKPITALEVNVSRLELGGGGGVALLRFLSEGGMTPGARVNVEGLNPGLQRMLETFTAEDFRAYRPHVPVAVRIPEEVGSIVMDILRDIYEQLEFIGGICRALAGTILHPTRLRWTEIKRVFELAGANSLPVVSLFSFLVGLVLALEAARPLAKFGAQIFIADMIGLSAIRDTGPIVTAIMLAGRSSSAFAAEIGTMKVNEELDALTTMGLNPIRFLVIQRVVGAMVLTPLVALYGTLMAIIGGVVVMRFLGFPPLMIYHQIVGQVQLNDVGVGLLKAVVFGIIVGGIGCLRGLQTKEGPRAVGHSATRAVVASIILIILANTIFSAVQYAFSK